MPENKQIIGFCGAQATGKTSLAKYFAENYPCQIELCIEGVRESAVELGVKSIKDILPYQRDPFQKLILSKHLKAISLFRESKKSILICDRTVIDIFAYTRLAKRMLEPISGCLEGRLADWCVSPLYSKVICFDMINIDDDKAEDGFRDMSTRRNIDHDINFLLNEFSIPFLRISDGWHDRINFVKWQLGLK